MVLTLVGAVGAAVFLVGSAGVAAFDAAEAAGVPVDEALERAVYTWAGPSGGELAVALVWLIAWLFGASMAAARGQALEMQRRQSINSDRQLKVLRDIRSMQPPTRVSGS